MAFEILRGGRSCHAQLRTDFIDMVVYRGGDQIASWGYASLMGLGLTLAQIPMISVPLSAIWLGLSVWLGRTHLNRNSAMLRSHHH